MLKLLSRSFNESVALGFVRPADCARPDVDDFAGGLNRSPAFAELDAVDVLPWSALRIGLVFPGCEEFFRPVLGADSPSSFDGLLEPIGIAALSEARFGATVGRLATTALGGEEASDTDVAISIAFGDAIGVVTGAGATTATVGPVVGCVLVAGLASGAAVASNADRASGSEVFEGVVSTGGDVTTGVVGATDGNEVVFTNGDAVGTTAGDSVATIAGAADGETAGAKLGAAVGSAVGLEV